jgi:hypothetical protein
MEDSSAGAMMATAMVPPVPKPELLLLSLREPV